MCDPLTRPHDNQPCLVRKCVDWVTGDWGQVFSVQSLYETQV